jgi:hypothetical protein
VKKKLELSWFKPSLLQMLYVLLKKKLMLYETVGQPGHPHRLQFRYNSLLMLYNLLINCSVVSRAWLGCNKLKLLPNNEWIGQSFCPFSKQRSFVRASNLHIIHNMCSWMRMRTVKHIIMCSRRMTPCAKRTNTRSSSYFAIAVTTCLQIFQTKADTSIQS